MEKEEQKFAKKSFIGELKLKKEDLNDYYKMKREYNYNNGRDITGIKLKEKVHPLILNLVKLQKKIIFKQSLTIIGDKRKPTNGPILYACTHTGRYDIENAMDAINDHCYLFMSDPETMYRTLDGAILNINGVIFMDSYDKKDRKIAKLSAENLLRKNGSLLIFPEGAWNLTENEVVMKLFPGTVDLALKTGAEIIPIAIEQYGNKYYANIGENISFINQDENTDVKELSKNLRDAMATLRWEIWEKFPESRQNISENYSEKYINDILKECQGYTIDDVNRDRFHDKNIVDANEVFAFNNSEKQRVRTLSK